MKKSELRNIIRETIKELVNEQWTPYIGVDTNPVPTGVDGGYQVHTWKHGMNPAHPSFAAAGSPSGYGEEQPVTYNTPNYNPDSQKIEKPNQDQNQPRAFLSNMGGKKTRWKNAKKAKMQSFANTQNGQYLLCQWFQREINKYETKRAQTSNTNVVMGMSGQTWSTPNSLIQSTTPAIAGRPYQGGGKWAKMLLWKINWLKNKVAMKNQNNWQNHNASSVDPWGWTSWISPNGCMDMQVYQMGYDEYTDPGGINTTSKDLTP